MDYAACVDVSVTRHFRISAERVFDAWLDPGTAGRWLFATALRPMSSVRIEAHAGGAFRFAQRSDGGILYSGHYVEIIRPRLLVFTLSCEYLAHDISRVRVEIMPLAAGCDLFLVQQNVPLEDADRTEGRWDGIFYGPACTLDK